MRLYRRNPAKPNLPARVAEAIAELRSIAAERPSLAQLALTVADVLPILFAEPVQIDLPNLTAARITEKWSARMPLLRGEDVPCDATQTARRWRDLCGAMAKRVPEISNATQLDAAKLPVLVRKLLDGNAQAVHGELAAHGLAPNPFATILEWTVMPTLVSLQSALATLLPSERWPHGYCPICGSWPALGEFRGLEQLRYMRCGLCAMAWEFPRLRCPYCGNDDHRLLGYLHADGEEGKRRIATCDACRGYVKMTATLTPMESVRLLVMEVATLPLDLIALERGYTTPATPSDDISQPF